MAQRSHFCQYVPHIGAILQALDIGTQPILTQANWGWMLTRLLSLTHYDPSKYDSITTPTQNEVIVQTRKCSMSYTMGIRTANAQVI